MTEDRTNLPPSASEYPRIKNCPGFLNLKRTIVRKDETDSEDAASGTRCHAAYAGESVELSDEERQLVDRAISITDNMAVELGFSGDDVKLIKEQRMFMDKMFTGKPDRVYLKGNKAFIPDAKFGRIQVEEADKNLQLRGYAVLVFSEYPDTEEVSTVPIQPLVTWSPKPVLYGLKDLYFARDELNSALIEADNPNAPRHAGSWCKYCPCQQHCDVAREYALSAPMKNMPAEITPDAIASTLTNQRLSDFLDRAKVAEDIIKACKDEAKRRLKDGTPVGDWTLKSTGSTYECIQPEVVYARCAEMGITQAQFMSCVSIGKGELEAAIKAATGCKGEALKAKLVDTLAGCMSEKRKAPSLAKNVGKLKA